MVTAQDTFDVSDLKENFLKCSVCFEHFDQAERRPRLLVNCLHAFCTQCLEHLLKNEGRGLVTCPNCRQVQEVKGNAHTCPIDPVRNKLVDFVHFKEDKKIPCTDCPDKGHAVARCQECQSYMCTPCKDAHQRTLSTRRHTCQSLKDVLSEPIKNFLSHYCKDHPDHKIEFYCKKCSSLCCVSCSIVIHKGHDLDPIDEAANSMLSSLKTKMEDVDKSTFLLMKKKTSLEKESKKHELSLKETTLSIQHTFKDLNGKLKIRENKLITQLQQRTESTVNGLKKQRETTEDSLAQIESAMEYFKQMESMSDDCEVLLAGPVLVKSLEASAAVDLTHDVQRPTWNFSPGQLKNWISKVYSEGKIIFFTADVEEEIVMENMKLVLGPHMNWYEMLNPAPLSVCLLAQLVLVTLEKDVCLVSNNMERKEFRHVKHQEPLRTSIVQVAIEGCLAFHTANKNMDQIRLLALQVPKHVKNAVKFIIGGSYMEIEELVPDILRNIARISETCIGKAQEVETQFTNVMELIGELQRARNLATGEYEEKLRTARADQEVKMKRKEEAEASRKRIDEEYNEMRDQLRKLREHEKTMDSIPSAAKTFRLLRSLRRQPKAKAKEDDPLVSEVEKLAITVQHLNEIASAWLNGTPVEDLLLYSAEASFRDVTGTLHAYTGKAKSMIVKIISLGSELCELLGMYSKRVNPCEKEKKRIITLLTQLDSKTNGLQNFVTVTFKENYQFKVNQASSTLEAARQDLKENSRRAEDASEKVANIIAELAEIKLEQVDFENIKVQWEKLVRFFQTMSNLIKCCMDENVKNFVQSAEKCKRFRRDYSLSNMLRDMIFTQASEAYKIAFMVNNVSDMYVEVSEKHIMDKVASLGHLLALAPETEKHLIVQKQLDLRRQAQEATSSIDGIVRQKQKEFDTKIQKWIKTIETEMRAVLSPPKPTAPEVEVEMQRDFQKVRKEKQQFSDWV